MKYFAYGSNMLSTRLKARVLRVDVVGVASVTGRQLKFHKRSQDDSSKCDIPQTANPADIVYGVLFEVPDDQLAALDGAEGEGFGYKRTTIDVSFNGSPISAVVYLAEEGFIDDRLLPYEWYHALVEAGAREHSLPADYVSRITAVKTKSDPIPARNARLEALDALAKSKPKQP